MEAPRGTSSVVELVAPQPPAGGCHFVRSAHHKLVLFWRYASTRNRRANKRLEEATGMPGQQCNETRFEAPENKWAISRHTRSILKPPFLRRRKQLTTLKLKHSSGATRWQERLGEKNDLLLTCAIILKTTQLQSGCLHKQGATLAHVCTTQYTVSCTSTIKYLI